MANGNDFVQRTPLPPLNSPTLVEADRARVYAILGKELDRILNGPTSYYPDGAKRNSTDLMGELEDYVEAVERLKEAVNDPTNIVGDALGDLKRFRGAFKSGVSNDVETMWNDRNDPRDERIRLPDSVAPTTEDHNIIYLDPEPDGLFSMPNPIAPRALGQSRASTVRPDVLPATTTSQNYRQLRPVNSTGDDAKNIRELSSPVLPLGWSRSRPGIPDQAWQRADRQAGIFIGHHTPGYPVPPPIFGLPDRSAASGDDMDDWFARWIQPLVR